MLETIWFILWVLLWAIYFILDGFDFGMGTLMPFLARGDAEKRVIYNASGPFWDGNEVWLITAGGVTFAAFPLAYATMFSALYAPLLILLFALILGLLRFLHGLLHSIASRIRLRIHRLAALLSPKFCSLLGLFCPDKPLLHRYTTLQIVLNQCL